MPDVHNFVIQEHTRSGRVHWDLMLEAGPVLQTYRLDLSPRQLLQQTAIAVRIFDHPIKFLTYQGSVNAGKGAVKIAESGTYELLHESHNQKQFRFSGKVLKGKFALTCIENDKWQFRSSR